MLNDIGIKSYSKHQEQNLHLDNRLDKIFSV